MSKSKPLGICETCKSEIVESVNAGAFGDGECDACEYERYNANRGESRPFFKMVEEDLQCVAKERFSRDLTPDEMRSAIKYFENGIEWYETAEIAVDCAIEDHAK